MTRCCCVTPAQQSLSHQMADMVDTVVDSSAERLVDQDVMRLTPAWLQDGVDFSLPGNGGPDCAAFLSPLQRTGETVVVGGASLAILLWSVARLQHTRPPTVECKHPVLLAAFALVFGVEVGYKLSSCQVTTHSYLTCTLIRSLSD